MKNNILIVVFTFFAFASYAQTEKSEVIEAETAVTEFKIKAENIDELKNFDWEIVDQIFKENDGDQKILLAFTFENTSAIDKSKVKLENFEVKATGLTSDLNKLTEQLKRSVEKLTAFYTENKS